MRILIISHYYKHKNAMASVRPIKLAKYFCQMGHDVTVLTSMQKDNWCKQELTPKPSLGITEIYAPSHSGMRYLIKVYELLQKRAMRKVRTTTEMHSKSTDLQSNANVQRSLVSNFKSTVKQKLSWLFYYTSDRLENYFLSRGLISSAKTNGLRGYDVVIATYPGAGVHKAGEWFKKRRRTRLFIADYRDPAYNPGGRTSRIELSHDKKVQDEAIKHADGVVCVSHGMAQSLREQYMRSELPEVFVVNNGFDPEDNIGVIPANLDKNKFNFVYTGALYHGRRTVEMLAPILKTLIDEKVISINELAVNYAGPDFEELQSQLRPYGLEEIAVDFGYVSREQSLGMQQESDIVLLLNWNDDNYTGVIPGKLYEYMSARKPIVALIMGNQAGSESARMIKECQIGCACEQASPSDLQILEKYIREKLSDFRVGKSSAIAFDNISPFEYKNIARKYMDVINRVNNTTNT